MEPTEEQGNSRDKSLANLLPYQYKKGQSGNPSGRAKGISMKEYLKMKFQHMNEEERENFLEGIAKLDLFKMGEGNPESKTDITTGGEKITMSPEAVALAKEYEEKLKGNL